MRQDVEQRLISLTGGRQWRSRSHDLWASGIQSGQQGAGQAQLRANRPGNHVEGLALKWPPLVSLVTLVPLELHFLTGNTGFTGFKDLSGLSGPDWSQWTSLVSLDLT